MDSQFLFLRLGGLGDLLMVLPALSYLRKTLPGGYFSLVCREEYGILLREAGMINEIIRLDGREARPLFSGFTGGDADPEIIRRFKKFSVILAWMQRPPTPEMERALKSLAISNFHSIVWPGSGSVRVSRFFFDETRTLFPARTAKAPAFEECARLTLGTEPGPGTQANLPHLAGKNYVVIHPGSGGESKRWPLNGFLEIVRRLAGRSIPGVLVTGEEEERLIGLLDGMKFPKGWTWIEQLPLLGLARLLAGAAFYVGNDSGVTHLAAACGTRVLALFRQDLECAWSPYGSSRVLSARAMTDIRPERVWAAIEGKDGFLRPS